MKNIILKIHQFSNNFFEMNVLPILLNCSNHGNFQLNITVLFSKITVFWFGCFSQEGQITLLTKPKKERFIKPTTTNWLILNLSLLNYNKITIQQMNLQVWNTLQDWNKQNDESHYSFNNVIFIWTFIAQAIFKSSVMKAGEE